MPHETVERKKQKQPPNFFIAMMPFVMLAQGWMWFRLSALVDPDARFQDDARQTAATVEEKKRQEQWMHVVDEKLDNTVNLIGHHASDASTSLHVVVPGLGASTRLSGLHQSLQALQDSSKQGGIGFSCAVYVWNKDLMEQATEKLSPCQVVFNEGLWTHHMLRVNESALGGTTHVAILIDDIDVTQVDASCFLETMSGAEYDVASAAIPDWHYDVLQPRQGCKSHRSDYADVLFTVFTIKAWKCWKRQINIDLNDNGWGYDVLLSEKCSVNVGIIDNAIAVHAGSCENGGECTRTYDGSNAASQLWGWIIHETGARNEEEAKAYWQHVVKERPKRFPRCDEYRSSSAAVIKADLNVNGLNQDRKESNDISESLEIGKLVDSKGKWTLFVLGDGRYYSTAEHRGGWKSVIQYLINDAQILEVIPGTASIHDNHKRLELQRKQAWEMLAKANSQAQGKEKLLLVDVTEKWFLDKGGPIDVPWVGITHFAANPPREGSLGMAKILRDPDFLQSLPHCRGIVVLASHMPKIFRQALSKKLGEGVNDLNICTGFHPIAVGDDAVPYDPKKDLDATFKAGHGFILLGQQYRRYVNFHRLQTNGRPKFWLPGSKRRGERVGAAKRAEKELEAAGVAKDKSIKMIYTKTFEEYDQMVKQNVVIVDLWSATANNAVLEAIALNSPFLVRSLPGTREYLGKRYPLFFKDFDGLQALLSDETRLRQLLLKGHLYLKAMDKSRFTMENFAKTLEACVEVK